MIGAANVRGLAFSALTLGALCVFGVSGPATAYGHPVHRSAGAAPHKSSAFALFGETRLQPVSTRMATLHAPAWQPGAWGRSGSVAWARSGSVAWARSGSWVRAGRGNRFFSRFHDDAETVAARSGHSGGVQCVTFARADTGIELEGNANAWWSNAAGLYQRGRAPEAGSVLSFQSNGAMRLGHVAVVNTVVDSRTVIVDHANWGGPGAGRGAISRSIPVVDVSPGNDWTAVRVGLGHSGEFGSIYPTDGFIYNRPDRGMMVASAATNAPVPPMNPAPRDLRAAGLREEAAESAEEEVAEAPEEGGHSYAYATPRYSRFGRHRRLVMVRGESLRGAFHGAALHTAAFHGRAAGRSPARRHRF